MAVILYNPKLFDGKPSQPVSYLFERKYWKLGVNEIAKFPEQVAEGMLSTYGFLRKVNPEDLENVKKEMEDKPFKCEHCGAEFSTEKALQGHLMGKHKLSEESREFLKTIPEVSIDEEFIPAKKLAPEQEEGIPVKGTDKDGVEWYGEGLEDDNLSDIKKSGGTF